MDFKDALRNAGFSESQKSPDDPPKDEPKVEAQLPLEEREVSRNSIIIAALLKDVLGADAAIQLIEEQLQAPYGQGRRRSAITDAISALCEKFGIQLPEEYSNFKQLKSNS